MQVSMTLFRSSRLITLACALLAGSVAGCTGDGDVRPQGPLAKGDPARSVTAFAETRVDDNPQVDADDPALWASSSHPERALLFGADKTLGLYVHNPDGSVREFFPVGPLVNVDLRDGFDADGRPHVLVGATNDGPDRLGINLFLTDPETLKTRPFAFLPTLIGEPYGFCMGRRETTLFLVVTTKSGLIFQWPLLSTSTGPALGDRRTLQLGGQLEGCVVDEATGRLYVGQEDFGVWSFDFDPAGDPSPTLIAAVDGVRLQADVEGLALMREDGATYLIVSSQGDSTFPVFRIEGPSHTYLGRFAIAAGEADAVTATDGVAAWRAPFGAEGGGVIAVHDDRDEPLRGQQNYKLVRWRDIKTALGLSPVR
jgi:3-phytase